MAVKQNIVVTPKHCDTSVKKAIQQLSTKLGHVSYYNFTASRLVSTDSDQKFASVTDLTAWIAGTANQITVADDADGTITLSIPDPFAVPGKLTAGSFASPLDVTNTREYGFELHYSGNNYDVTGIRSRAQLVTTNTTATALGGLFQAANNDGINAGVLMGFMAEAIGKSTANASTITTMRGGLIGTEWGALDTITNLKTLHIRGHSLNAAGAGSFGTGYALYIENEAVGGNGQAYDAGIYFKGTNLSAGNKSFTYGIDFSGGTFSSEEIKLANGSVVGSDKVTLQPTTDSTTFFQVLDADGGVPILNVDTTNERVGIGTATPESKLHIEHSLFPVIRGVRTGNTTTVVAAALDFVYKTSSDMADGFGGGVTASIQDATGGPYYIAGFYGVRSGSDITGSFAIYTRNAGAWNEKMRVTNTGYVGINEIAPETLLELTHATPYITLHNSSHEFGDGDGESRLIFKREDGDGTETAAGQIEISHDGTTDNDQLGKMQLSVNTGAALVDVFEIDSSGNTKIGDGGTTNYTKIEADGTIEFNGAATVWNDANLGVAQLALPTAAQPDEDEFVDEVGGGTGISTWAFAVGEKVSGSIEIPHDYKEGSDITFHIHWQGITAPTGTDNVKWQCTYTVAQAEATLDARASTVVETAYDTQYEFKISSCTAITGTNFNMEDQFLFTLERVVAAGDAYAGDALVATVGIHYECDTVGSRAILTK